MKTLKKGEKMIFEKYKNILKELEEAQKDIEKSIAGNASAGRRARKSAMSAINNLKELRALILENSKK